MSEEQPIGIDARTNDNDLLACPFCGKAPESRSRYRDTGAGDGHRAFIVKCVNAKCGVRPKVVRYGPSEMTGQPGWVGGMDSGKSAEMKVKEVWNTRLGQRSVTGGEAMTKPTTCPFCGSIDQLLESLPNIRGKKRKRVMCKQCRACGPEAWDESAGEAREKAKAAWEFRVGGEG